jgi:ribosomal protein L11 methylase PrmA
MTSLLLLAAGLADIDNALWCRELREGAMRRCQQQQTEKFGAAAAEEAFAAKLSATRQHNINMRQHQHIALQQKYDQQLASAIQLSQAELAQASSTRRSAAAQLRQHEQQQWQQHAQHAYKPFSSCHTTMQERLQSLAAGRELE